MARETRQHPELGEIAVETLEGVTLSTFDEREGKDSARVEFDWTGRVHPAYAWADKRNGAVWPLPVEIGASVDVEVWTVRKQIKDRKTGKWTVDHDKPIAQVGNQEKFRRLVRIAAASGGSAPVVAEPKPEPVRHPGMSSMPPHVPGPLEVASAHRMSGMTRRLSGGDPESWASAPAPVVEPETGVTLNDEQKTAALRLLLPEIRTMSRSGAPVKDVTDAVQMATNYDVTSAQLEWAEVVANGNGEYVRKAPRDGDRLAQARAAQEAAHKAAGLVGERTAQTRDPQAVKERSPFAGPAVTPPQIASRSGLGYGGARTMMDSEHSDPQPWQETYTVGPLKGHLSFSSYAAGDLTRIVQLAQRLTLRWARNVAEETGQPVVKPARETVSMLAVAIEVAVCQVVTRTRGGTVDRNSRAFGTARDNVREAIDSYPWPGPDADVDTMRAWQQAITEHAVETVELMLNLWNHTAHEDVRRANISAMSPESRGPESHADAAESPRPGEWPKVASVPAVDAPADASQSTCPMCLTRVPAGTERAHLAEAHPETLAVTAKAS